MINIRRIQFNYFVETSLNNTIEETVSLLEIQVADLREDMSVVHAGVVELDEDVDFLFDEQVIQDEKLLDLEKAVNVIESDLIAIDGDVESEQ